MDSILSLIVYFLLGTVLVVGIGIAIQLDINKKKKHKEAEKDKEVRNDLASKE